MSVPWAGVSMREAAHTAAHGVAGRLQRANASPCNRQPAHSGPAQLCRYICLRGKSMNGQLWPRWRNRATKLAARVRALCHVRAVKTYRGSGPSCVLSFPVHSRPFASSRFGMNCQLQHWLPVKYNREMTWRPFTQSLPAVCASVRPPWIFLPSWHFPLLRQLKREKSC